MHTPCRCCLGLMVTRIAAALLGLAAALLTSQSPLGQIAAENASALRGVDRRWARQV